MKKLIGIAVLVLSSAALASTDDFEQFEHLLPIGGGIAHPSFSGNTGYDAPGQMNPTGYGYDDGLGIFAHGSSTSGTNVWNHRGGLVYGQKMFGLGIFETGSTTAGTTQVFNWGLDVNLSSMFAIAVGGNSSLSVASLMINPRGTHRLGFYVSSLNAASSTYVYSLGYAYEEKIFTFAVGANWLPSSNSGTGHGGLGLHWEKYLLVLNYDWAIGTGASSTGTLTGGGGILLGKSFALAATYGSGNLFSALISYTF